MNEQAKIEINGLFDIDCQLMFISQNLRLMLDMSEHGLGSNAPHAAENMVIALCKSSLRSLRDVVHDLSEKTNLLDSGDSEVRREFDRMVREWKIEESEDDEAEGQPVASN